MPDWSKFTKRISIKASIQKIYDAWASQSSIEMWFLRKALYKDPSGKIRGKDDSIQAGDDYEWMWFGYPDEVVERNKILESNGRDLMKFGFAGKCIVMIRICEEEGENVIELTQENIPDDENPSTNLFVGCGEGWISGTKILTSGKLSIANRLQPKKIQ